MKHGFSLVELSIVLVILGLLTGGILAGQSLIRASELRSVAAEYQRYQAAGFTFRDKYFGIPGDFRDATKFWGRQQATAPCVTNSGAAVATPGTCDGNGDGYINTGVTSDSGENFQFWRQLAHAGLIEGSYTGLALAGGANDADIGVNVPRSKLTNSGWSTYYIPGLYAGDGNFYRGIWGNLYYFGSDVTNSIPYNPSMKAEEVWNIDTKLDDGKPGSGKVITYWRGACTDSTAVDDYAAGYNLDTTTISCTPFFPNIF